MQFISPFFRSRADTCKLERLPIECRKYLHVLWLSINTLCNWFKYRSVIQSEVRPKPSVTRSCIFPALFAVNVYFSLDWFIGLSAFFVIVPFSNLPYKPTDYFASLLSNLSNLILLFSDLCQVVLTRRGQQMLRRSASYNRSQMQRFINW